MPGQACTVCTHEAKEAIDRAIVAGGSRRTSTSFLMRLLVDTGRTTCHPRSLKLRKPRMEPGFPCPTWLKFLDDVMEGNEDLTEYLKRAVGYSLTGIWSRPKLVPFRVTFFDSEMDGEYQLVEPKSAKGRRTLAMPGIVVEALQNHRGQQISQKLRAGAKWKDSDLVFTSKYGTPLNRHNVTRDFKVLLDGAGLPQQRFHDLRHTAASLMLAQNVQPRDLMEILGHSQISLTMNTYSHVMPAPMSDAAERINSVLTG